MNRDGAVVPRFRVIATGVEDVTFPVIFKGVVLEESSEKAMVSAINRPLA